MEIIETNNCIALIHDGVKIFVHSNKLPFLQAVDERGRVTEATPLANYKIIEATENVINIRFSGNTKQADLTVKNIDGHIELHISSNSDYLIISLHTEVDDLLYFDEYVLSERIFVKSEKEKVITPNKNPLRKLFSMNTTEIVCKKRLSTVLTNSNGYQITLSNEPKIINAEDSLCLVIHTKSNEETISLSF